MAEACVDGFLLMTRDRHSECFALFQRLAAGSPPLRSVQSWGEKNSAALKFWRRV